MKLPEIYKKRDKTEKIIPAFVFQSSGFEYAWNVVDPVSGKLVATIQTINNKGFRIGENAKDTIRREGFSVDWAVWDDKGRFVRFNT